MRTAIAVFASAAILCFGIAAVDVQSQTLPSHDLSKLKPVPLAGPAFKPNLKLISLKPHPRHASSKTMTLAANLEPGTPAGIWQSPAYRIPPGSCNPHCDDNPADGTKFGDLREFPIAPGEAGYSYYNLRYAPGTPYGPGCALDIYNLAYFTQTPPTGGTYVAFGRSGECFVAFQMDRYQN